MVRLWPQSKPRSGAVWTQSKTDGGKIGACVKMVGESVPPRKEEPYSKEAEAQLIQTVRDREQQGVIRKTSAPFNSPAWPGLKAEGSPGG